MKCFFIDAGPRQIFASLVEPRKAVDNDTAVLLCYPFGQEYMRAHRAFRQLAMLVSRGGMPVMRFDYPGSGDSFGLAEDIAFSDYLDAARRAVQALKTMSKRGKVHIAGLRLGALVAAVLASENDTIESVVLWDPLAGGREYLEDWRTQRGAASEEEGLWWLNGYPLNQQFRAQIAQHAILDIGFSEQTQIAQIVSHENASTQKLLSKVSLPTFSQELVPSLGNWNYVDRDGSILMPTEIIKAVSKQLLQAA